MRAQRFSRIAFVRRLDRVYDDLQGWAMQYRVDHYTNVDADPKDRLLERAYALDEACYQIRDARDFLLSIRRVR